MVQVIKNPIMPVLWIYQKLIVYRPDGVFVVLVVDAYDYVYLAAALVYRAR